MRELAAVGALTRSAAEASGEVAAAWRRRRGCEEHGGDERSEWIRGGERKRKRERENKKRGKNKKEKRKYKRG